MSETNKLIIDLIKQDYSLREIAEILKITEKQLYIRIKQIINQGYQLYPNYRCDSEIYYKILYGKQENYTFSISMPKKEQTFRCIVISDLHIGNINSDIKLLDYVYEYATKNGINYVFVCGDNVEGDYTVDRKYIKNVYDQVEELIKKYPYDKNINNVMIYGNHDHHSLKEEGFNASQKIKNARYDIIPIGYGQGTVNIKNDNLILFHKLNESTSPVISNDEKLILSGHGHMMKTKIKEQLWLCVPTLSYVSVDKTVDVIPGFIDLTLDFSKGKFDFLGAKHIIITPKLITINETRCKMKIFENINLDEVDKGKK